MATSFLILVSSLAYVSAWEALLTTVHRSPSLKRTASEEFRFRVPLPACVDPFFRPIDGRPLTKFSSAIYKPGSLGGAVLQRAMYHGTHAGRFTRNNIMHRLGGGLSP